VITVKSSDSFATNQSSVLSTIGQSLKQARLDCSLSLDDVSAKTHISTRYLKAIEDGALDELPEPVYVRGFLRRYCDAVSTADLSESFPVTIAECQKQWNNTPSTELRPLHLYALYVAVVIGTVTALASFLTPPQTAKISDSETKFGKSAQLETNKGKDAKAKRRYWVPTLEGIEVLRQSGKQFAAVDGNSINASSSGAISNSASDSTAAKSAVNSAANDIANDAAFVATGEITNANSEGSKSITAQVFRRVIANANVGTENQSGALNSRTPNITQETKGSGQESFADANVGLGTFLNDWSGKTAITRTAKEEQIAGSFEFSPNKPLNVGIITTGSSWLRVLVDDKTVFEGVAPEGKQFSWSGDQRISVRAGNAGAVMLAFNSKNARRLGKEGDVIEKRFGGDRDGSSSLQNRLSNSSAALSNNVSNGDGASRTSVVESN